MRPFIAILMGLAIGTVGIGMLRGLRGSHPTKAFEQPETPPADTRILFWCETCGTEVLLIRKGSEAAPRHCGESMLRREEVIPG